MVSQDEQPAMARARIPIALNLPTVVIFNLISKNASNDPQYPIQFKSGKFYKAPSVKSGNSCIRPSISLGLDQRKHLFEVWMRWGFQPFEHGHFGGDLLKTIVFPAFAGRRTVGFAARADTVSDQDGSVAQAGQAQAGL